MFFCLFFYVKKRIYLSTGISPQLYAQRFVTGKSTSNLITTLTYKKSLPNIKKNETKIIVALDKKLQCIFLGVGV